jgi:hypothetical protein
VDDLFVERTNNPYFAKTYFFENQIISHHAPFTQLNTPYPATARKGF